MAEPKVRIPIELPAGDMSGAEEAKREIAEVKDAAAAAEDPALAKQRIDDVAAARKRASDRRIEDQEKELAKEKDLQLAAQDSARLRIAAGAALAASARQIAALTVDVIGQYKELGVEIGAFEDIGLEFANFLTSPFEYVTDAFTGYKEELKLLQEGQREVARAEAVYQETLRAKRAEIRKENEAYVNGSLAREIQVIDEITAAYERQKNEINALNKAREASIRAAEDQAVLAGTATPEGVAAARSGREQSAAQAEVQATVADAQARYQEADEKAQAAISAYAAAQALNLNTTALAAQADAAVAARDQALLDVESVKNVAAASGAELASTAISEQTRVVDSTKDALTKAAADAKTTLDNEAAEQGRTLSAGGKEALKILTDALKDGVVTPEEMQAVATAIQQVKNSRDGADAEIKEAFENLSKANDAARESLQILNQRSLDQRQQMEALRAQIGG